MPKTVVPTDLQKFEMLMKSDAETFSTLAEYFIPHLNDAEKFSWDAFVALGDD